MIDFLARNFPVPTLSMASFTSFFGAAVSWMDMVNFIMGLVLGAIGIATGCLAFLVYHRTAKLKQLEIDEKLAILVLRKSENGKSKQGD